MFQFRRSQFKNLPLYLGHTFLSEQDLQHNNSYNSDEWESFIPFKECNIEILYKTSQAFFSRKNKNKNMTFITNYYYCIPWVPSFRLIKPQLKYFQFVEVIRGHQRLLKFNLILFQKFLSLIRRAAKKFECLNQKLRQGHPPPTSNMPSPPTPFVKLFLTKNIKKF